MGFWWLPIFLLWQNGKNRGLSASKKESAQVPIFSVGKFFRHDGIRIHPWMEVKQSDSKNERANSSEGYLRVGHGLGGQTALFLDVLHRRPGVSGALYGDAAPYEKISKPSGSDDWRSFAL